MTPEETATATGDSFLTPLRPPPGPDGVEIPVRRPSPGGFQP